MMDHHVERYADRRFFPQDNHAQGIAYEKDVDSGAVNKQRHRRVIRGQHCDLCPPRFILRRSGTRTFTRCFVISSIFADQERRGL